MGNTVHTEEKRYSMKNAVIITAMCVAMYMMKYVIAHILSVLTPILTQDGVFTKDYIGVLTSAYCWAYALGQLLNGVIGDFIKPKTMVLIGLCTAGAAFILFPVVPPLWVKAVLYGFSGFGLSMLRGPLIKSISENLEKKAARVGCACFSMMSFLGPFIASFVAMIFVWTTVFYAVGAACLVLAAAGYVAFSVLERKGVIRYAKKEKVKGKKLDVFAVFKLKNFVVYLFLGMIFEIQTTTIVFWRPTYITEHLGLSADVAGVIHSVMSLASIVNPFLALFVCKALKNRDILGIRVLLLCALAFYAGMFFISNVWVNLILFMLACVAAGCASGIMWTYYIPGLGKSGRVSSVNGILDCSGYCAAALANLFLADIVGLVGWRGTILVWGGIMLVGAAITFFAGNGENEEDVLPTTAQKSGEEESGTDVSYDGANTESTESAE